MAPAVVRQRHGLELLTKLSWCTTQPVRWARKVGGAPLQAADWQAYVFDAAAPGTPDARLVRLWLPDAASVALEGEGVVAVCREASVFRDATVFELLSTISALTTKTGATGVVGAPRCTLFAGLMARPYKAGAVVYEVRCCFGRRDAPLPLPLPSPPPTPAPSSGSGCGSDGLALLARLSWCVSHGVVSAVKGGSGAAWADVSKAEWASRVVPRDNGARTTAPDAALRTVTLRLERAARRSGGGPANAANASNASTCVPRCAEIFRDATVYDVLLAVSALVTKTGERPLSRSPQQLAPWADDAKLAGVRFDGHSVLHVLLD
jgi:hypothetical protein